MKHKRNLPILPEDKDPIATSKRDSREDQFLNLLFQGLSIKDAGLAAGYSPSYCETSIRYKFNDPAFQDKVRAYAISHNSSSIPKVVRLYQRSLDIMSQEVEQGNLDNLAKLKHIPTQMLQIGKLLASETPQSVINLVNIESLQAIIQNKVNGNNDK
jgi:hypothetical protein